MNEQPKQEEQKQEERDPQLIISKNNRPDELPYIEDDWWRWQKEIDEEEKRLQKRFYERW